MAYFTELEIRIERRIRNTEGDFDKVGITQKVKFEPEQVRFGEDGSTFTIEQAADTLRDIVTDKFNEWAAPKQAPRVVPRTVARPPPEEPEYEDEQPEEEPREQKRSLSPFKKKQ